MNQPAWLEEIQPVDAQFLERARERSKRLVMPPGAMGRLHQLAERLCAIRRTLTPRVQRKHVLLMAGDHGVATEGVSAYPQQVTGEMVKTFLRGGATINALARCAGARVQVVDMGVVPELPGQWGLVVKKVARGTQSIARGPAMSKAQARQCLETGFELASEQIRCGCDLLGLGDMGIGNTTPSSALGVVLCDRPVGKMVGPGTGLDERGLRAKQALVERALEVNRPDPADPLGLLAGLGGFEIGGIAGAMLAGARHRRPVLVDGFIATAAALLADALCPHARGYFIAAHASAEPGHRHMLRHLGLEPLLTLDMRLGEGTGAVLAMPLVDAAAALIQEVQTFEEAGVSNG